MTDQNTTLADELDQAAASGDSDRGTSELMRRAAIRLRETAVETRRAVWDAAIRVARQVAWPPVQDMVAGPVFYQGADEVLEALGEAKRADVGADEP